MPEDKRCEPPPLPQKKKKTKKKKKKAEAPSTSTKDAEKPHPAPSEPPPVPTMGPPRAPLPKLKTTPKKDTKRPQGGGRKSKKSPVSLLSLVCKSSGSPVQSYVSQLSAEALESVRWEGVLDDPLEEESRLEVYRANRRQRYVKHREMQLREMEEELKFGTPK